MGTEEEGGIDLDELEREAARLVALLRNRQPGLKTWDTMLTERLRVLKGLIEQTGV